MPEVEQFTLAILGAIGFGYIAWKWFHMPWQRLLIWLVVLWTLQTAPQYLYRWLDGEEVVREVANVTVLRSMFTLVCVTTVALLTRYRGGSDA